MPRTTARPGGGAQLDHLVEHRHERVQALDRELLLAEEGLVEIGLEGLDLLQALEQIRAASEGERLAIGAPLDRLAQPDALLVVRDARSRTR